MSSSNIQTHLDQRLLLKGRVHHKFGAIELFHHVKDTLPQALPSRTWQSIDTAKCLAGLGASLKTIVWQNDLPQCRLRKDGEQDIAISL